jgi:hypothetical protein
VAHGPAFKREKHVFLLLTAFEQNVQGGRTVVAVEVLETTKVLTRSLQVMLTGSYHHQYHSARAFPKHKMVDHIQERPRRKGNHMSGRNPTDQIVSREQEILKLRRDGQAKKDPSIGKLLLSVY